MAAAFTVQTRDKSAALLNADRRKINDRLRGPQMRTQALGTKNDGLNGLGGWQIEYHACSALCGFLCGVEQLDTLFGRRCHPIGCNIEAANAPSTGDQTAAHGTAHQAQADVGHGAIGRARQSSSPML
jgi:hypothetical protein